ncbi:hypothetical protein [Pseudonocardia phyllosphaerae]|uniref:hypothetical protein n=1 Tax=Pseudonocardia phyllosphaerae TaxID=3390502 RepID=UPI00397A0FEF
MDEDTDTHRPSRSTRSRRVVAWVLIVALAGLPLSYLAGTAGPRLTTVVVVVVLLIGATLLWLHRRTR